MRKLRGLGGAFLTTGSSVRERGLRQSQPPTSKSLGVFVPPPVGSGKDFFIFPSLPKYPAWFLH
jgi:hypothetical protein